MNCISCYVDYTVRIGMDRIDAYTNNLLKFVRNTYTVGEE